MKEDKEESSSPDDVQGGLCHKEDSKNMQHSGKECMSSE
jgi:hypothetical protein